MKTHSPTPDSKNQTQYSAQLIDIKPIEKSEEHFLNWVDNYPFYANVSEEGVTLYGAA